MSSRRVELPVFSLERMGERVRDRGKRTGGMHRSIAPIPRDGLAVALAAEQPPPSSPSFSDDGRGRTLLRGTGTILSRLDAAAGSVVGRPVLVVVGPRRGDLELLGSSVVAVAAAVRAAVVRGVSTLTCFFWPGVVRSDPPLETAAAVVVVRLVPMIDPS